MGVGVQSHSASLNDPGLAVATIASWSICAGFWRQSPGQVAEKSAAAMVEPVAQNSWQRSHQP